MCCSVLCPSLVVPSPKLHRKMTSVPTVTRQRSVTVWFCRTEARWTSLLSFTAFWMTSGNTSEVREVRPPDTTTTTSYLHQREVDLKGGFKCRKYYPVCYQRFRIRYMYCVYMYFSYLLFSHYGYEIALMI